MSKKTLKGAALAAMLGTVFQLGGCFGSLGDIFGQGFLLDVGRNAVTEFIWDTDALGLDLFGDSAPGVLL